MSEKRKEVTQRITDAFADAQRPDQIFKPEGGYYFDAEAAAEGFKGKHWREIPLEVLIKNRDRLSWLTDEAFHFYLPAFLLAAIDHPREVDVLVDNVLHKLVPPDPNASYIGMFWSRVQTFNRQQAEAILGVFEAYTELYPPDEWSYTDTIDKEVKQAIAFWKKQLSHLTD